MKETEDTMSSECSENVDSPSTEKFKPKKRSIVERELETNLTEKVTSPVVNGGGSTSRYGRSRRSKCFDDKTTLEPLISPKSEHIAYKMHASNSPVKINNASPIRTIKIEPDLNDQIANIYNENILLSRFGSDKKKDLSPGNNQPKVYVRKDLIQKKDNDETVLLIKDMFSPSRSNSHLNNILERDKFSMKSKAPNDPKSVVKTLDFDSGKSKKRDADKSKSVTKSELFDMEAKCDYQVGDLVWARMGTFPFWPCLVTRDPFSGMFVKKKLFGRIERDVIHVTFFGDNGRRGWIVENMLRPFTGVLEFKATRDKFTPEAKKKDPRLYAAFFISDKRMPQWNLSVEEAETVQREPKRLRIDVFNEILSKSRMVKSTPKSRGKAARANSDVSLSESLYDTLFSEDDGKSDEDKCKNKRKNQSFDVSDVVTACLDNMAAKTGITKIQRQSHMDRWLQKAKSKTPEKNQLQKLSKSLLLVKTPKKEQENKSRETKIMRKSTSSIKTPKKSERNRRTLNRSANIDKVYDENINVISNQIDNNHVICNGDIDHSLDTTVDISMSSINNDEVTEFNVDNVAGEIEMCSDSVLQNEVGTTATGCEQTCDGNDEAKVSTASVLNQENIMGLEQNAPLEENEPTLSIRIHETEKQKVEEEDKICQEDCNKKNDIDFSKVNGHHGDGNLIDTSVEPESLNLKNNNYKIINGVTKSTEISVNGFIDTYLSINVVKDILKTNEIDKSNEISEDTVFNVEQSKPDVSVVSKNKKVVESLPEVVEDSQEVGIIDEISTVVVTKNTTKVIAVENDLSEQYKDSDSISTSSNDNSSIKNHDSKSTLIQVETDKVESEGKTDKDVATGTFEKCDDPIDREVQSSTLQVVPSVNDNINHRLDCTTNDNHDIANSKLEKPVHKSKSNKNVKLLENFTLEAALNNLEFVKYLELKQDSLLEENPSLTQDDIASYLYKTWQYEENSKSDAQKTDEKDASSLVKGINVEHVPRFRSKKRILSVKLTRHENRLGNATTVSDKIEDCDETSSLSSQGSKTSLRLKLRSNASKTPSVYSVFATKATGDDFKHKKTDDDTFSITSESRRASRRMLRSRNSQSPDKDHNSREQSLDKASDLEYDPETESVYSQTSSNSDNANANSLERNDKLPAKSSVDKIMEIPEFVKYVELNQDNLMEQHPDLTQDEIITYLYKSWQYEEGSKSDTQISDDIVQSNLVKGTNQLIISKSLSRFRKRVLRVRLSDYSTESENLCDNANEDDFISMSSEKCDETNKIINEDVIIETAINESVEINQDDETTKIINEDNIIESLINKSVEIKLDNETTGTPESAEQSSKRQLRSRLSKDPCNIKEDYTETSKQSPKSQSEENFHEDVKKEIDDTASISSLSSEKSCKVELQSSKSPSASAKSRDESPDIKSNTDYDPETVSLRSEDSATTTKKRRGKNDKLPNTFSMNIALQIPEFVKYLELRQDGVMDENPELSHEDIVAYLYKTWLYEESTKSEFQKTDEIDQSNLVKGLNQEPAPPPKRVKKKIKKEPKIEDDEDEVFPKEKRKRNVPRLSYNEEYVDIEEDDSVPYFEIFKTNSVKGAKTTVESKTSELSDTVKIETNRNDSTKVKDEDVIEIDDIIEASEYDEVEIYFESLVKPKPNVFKGLVREKVCKICEKTSNLVKCKGCHNMFHVECANKETKVVELGTNGSRAKKKNKPRGRKPKNVEFNNLDESHSDGKSQDHSKDETQMSVDEIFESKIVTNIEDFEAQLEAKMKEMLDQNQVNYDSYSSDELCWSDTEAGKCKIVDVKLKPRTKPVDLSNFKCKDCQINATPVCFVCNEAVSKTGVKVKQKCNVAHCNKYYHLECLKVWPQTQFTSGEPSKNNKKINEHFEALTCPRHVCHTCVCDDPRGCKTRFSGDKLARCVRCPATYHSFTKCLPAGSQILTGSHIICPRHYENRPGKVPCHVNTGWCFICALGGSLICCEFCPTSFHAECLNIKPPEGGYMCEDCETGRLPLYGEMVWVKLGHYRWWPGIILHPSEITENILAVKHSPGEFVVRFFGQYDHYWVNRGRVFPFQEGDSGRISSQKSKIDADFTMAMEHAQRACEILKTAPENEEESSDIASSLLPPHYVKLKVNKPCGSLIGKKVDIDESSLTQCECDPKSQQPCGPYTHCLNRILLTECGPTCQAGERCNNRAFEKRQYPKLVPYRTPHRGWGLKTLEMIPAGQFVIEYVGDLIDEEEFRRRMTRQHEIRDENFYFLTLDKERMIDAGPKGNLARFMNHCCEPNCETQKWTVLGDVRVGLFAINDIPANSEVTFNYNFECVGIEKKKCLCGAKRCSGYIGAKPKQDESQTKKTPKVNGKRPYKKRKPSESPTTKRPRGRPLKRRELTDIEKDLLIIKNATNGISSDSESGRISIEDSKALKRKRVDFSTEEGVVCNGKQSPSAKRMKLEDNTSEG